MGREKVGPLVVGIGVSAGGIEALEAMFRGWQGPTGLAFVVVSHLAPGRESNLPAILGRFTAMPVAPARDGERPRADHVHVAPPDAVLTVRGGRLRLRPVAPEAKHERSPIDVFLGSLAEDAGERAIAVILSGAGSDGTLGLMAVKEAGGLTVAQGQGASRLLHAGMPTSAIASGSVDLVLPAEAILPKLVEYARSFGALQRMLVEKEEAPAPERPTATARETICRILRDQAGHDFAGYKERTFLRRVQRRMQVLQLLDLDAYVERLRQDPEEVTRLFHDLLIGVTSFFRDAEAFEALEKLVIPTLFEGKRAGDSVRVWVPGCATGEEAYSIAILLREFMDTLKAPPKVQVFASDIAQSSLKLARTGRYPAALVAGVSPERLRRFFTGDGDSYVVTKQVRDMCVFSEHSVLRDPPYSRLDLISCRNLLIYLDAETQARLIPIFHYALRPEGVLFLGSAENATQHGDLFAPIDRKARLFRRRDQTRPALLFPLLLPGLQRPAADPAAGPKPSVAGFTLQRRIEAEVLERFAPAHVVVNREGDAVYHSPRTGKYLELPAGQPTQQVLAMARKGLRLDLRLALQEAMATRRTVTRERAALELDDGRVQLVTITVAPLPERGEAPLFLVLFTDLGPPARPDEAQKPPLASNEADLRQLQMELQDTRERLQSSIEEYETAIEEVKSANEELETSKEEIQSINEELHTVNRELASKVDELNQVNADLQNLFASTGIGLVFLDRQLAIRSFTPAISGLFNLIPADRGRPLADIASRFDYPGLDEDLRAVLARGEPIERRVSAKDGRRHYLMRILPYRDDGTVDGVIVTTFDITALAQAERQQQLLIHELNHRVRNMLGIVAAIARQTAARTESLESFVESFLGRLEALGRAYGLVTRAGWDEVAVGELARAALEPHLMDGEASRIALAGPPVMLPLKVAMSLGLVLHELATNAVKHGALSTSDGRVAVDWHAEEREGGRRLVLSWRETGGPPAVEPSAKGFGSELIEGEIAHELGGEVEMAFGEQGLSVRLAVPWRSEPSG